jgi:hypothetical protein
MERAFLFFCWRRVLQSCNQERASERIAKARLPAREFKAGDAPAGLSGVRTRNGQQSTLRLFDEGRDVNWLHQREIRPAATFTPVPKPARRLIIVCAPGVPVFLLRMLAVKNSQKRSEAFGSDRNTATWQ